MEGSLMPETTGNVFHHFQCLNAECTDRCLVEVRTATTVMSLDMPCPTCLTKMVYLGCKPCDGETYSSFSRVAREVMARLETSGFGKPGEANTFWAMVHAACDELDALRIRRDELLVTIRGLSASTPYPEEAGNAAVLIAEVGTLKARVASLTRQVAEYQARRHH